MRACAVLAVALLAASPAAAQSFQASFMPGGAASSPNNPWRIAWSHATALPEDVVSSRPLLLQSLNLRRLNVQEPASPAQQPLHATAIEHSDAYQTRVKIHKVASYATLPLFATQLWLGQSLYNSSDDGTKGAHAVVGASIAGLFGLNTVTGAWNLFGEDRQQKEGRALRITHAILMMAADAGFAATSMVTPESEGRLGLKADSNTHRALAFTSIGLGTAGYLLMLFGHR